jgi:UDP-N-acetyl-D-mannosaminuronate dehydrogenase
MGGGGHVGLPLSIVFASHGKKVRIFDINRKTIDTSCPARCHSWSMAPNPS